MAVTVTFVSALGNSPAPEVHPTGTMVDVDFDHLFVYSAPDKVIATYSKNNWLGAVVS